MTGLDSSFRIDAICDQFETALRAGGEPRIEEVLAAHADVDRQELLRELLLVYGDFLRGCGRSLNETELRSRFPHDGDVVSQICAGSSTPPAPGGSTDVPFLTVPAMEEALPAMVGRFRVIRLLGEGGMGQVLLAEDPDLRRMVAIKLTRFLTLPGNSLAQRFAREARAAAGLDHPHICPIYDVGQHNGRPFICMKYINGEPLSQRLRQGALPADEAVPLIRKVAGGLSAAHARGIIHRDLKPDNVLMTIDGEPVLTDFGLAAELNSDASETLTLNGELLGTPAYMAPEQIRCERERVGPHSDVYSLGVIFYEMLTGRRPFRGKGLVAMSEAMRHPVTPPTAIRTDIDPQLETVCLRMFAREIPDRFASMAAVLEALPALGLPPPKVSRRRRGSAVSTPGERTAAGTVLIADASADARRGLCEALAPLGVHVIEAGDALEVVAAVRRQAVDVVLLDLAWPAIDVRNLLKKPDADERPRVLMLAENPTAATTQQSLVRWIGQGAADYVVKGDDPALIAARVSNYLPPRGRGEAQRDPTVFEIEPYRR